MEIRQDRPSYVMFEKRPVEDRPGSLANGYYTTKDEDFVVITPIGSKDRIPRVVKDWFVQMEQQVQEGRVPAAHLEQYKGAYKAWKSGQEIPLNGVPIKTWPVLSPAQILNIIAADIRTVEDLAQANDEALKRIGMGSLELKDKAKAWLKEASTKGSVVTDNAGLSAKNRVLEQTVKDQQATIQDLKLELETLSSRLATETN